MLAGPEGHHAATVQRLRVGEAVAISDGRGTTATATIVGVGRSTLELTIDERRYEEPPSPRLVVAQAIAKGDRGELAVQAMTEVGVDEIVPWAASRSVALWRGERGERAWRKWQVTAREAAKQSRRSWLPTVSAAATTAGVADRLRSAAAGFVLHEAASERLSHADLPNHGEIVLVVGPEGGVAPAELEAFHGSRRSPGAAGAHDPAYLHRWCRRLVGDQRPTGALVGQAPVGVVRVVA